MFSLREKEEEEEEEEAARIVVLVFDFVNQTSVAFLTAHNEDYKWERATSKNQRENLAWCKP